MKKILKILGLIALVLIALGAIVYFFFPQKLVDMTNSQNASAADLTAKTVDLDGYTTHYYESQSGVEKDTLVLVHGLGDEKNSFAQSAKFLKDDYYLILPDLAGSGENARDEDKDYSIRGQVEFLHSLLSKLGVSKFNLVGNSMGGHVSAAYTLAYPEEVKNLVLLNAAGLKLDDHVVYGGFAEPLKGREDLKAVFDRVLYKAPEIPGPVADLMVKQINDSRDFLNNNVTVKIKKGKDFNLKDRISQISAPTLVLWGKHDKVVQMNVAERYDRDIPLSKLQLLEEGGHSPQMEIPEEVANGISNFIKSSKSELMNSTKAEHAAKTQLYRWYQFYERDIENKKRLMNQLGILAEDVTITSAAGEMKGRDNYPPRLSVYKGWTNAHHVKQVSVNENENGLIDMEVDILYQNKNAHGERANYTIHYTTQLENTDKGLPVFKSLLLQPTGKTEKDPLEDAYPTNRTKSLMHYWLLNMEQLDGNAEPFRELLTSDFELHFSTATGTPMTKIEELEAWLKGVPSKLKQSTHRPEGFKVQDLGGNKYQVNVNFKWMGVDVNGNALAGTTAHEWMVVDDPTERFARIESVKVKQIEPMHPIK
ncbi:alpha/beta hydrolase [Maribacter sp.]|nr:alpha/beta hydrolase [Maribacter sp.]